MMIKPGITELDKYVDSRYTLVSMVSKRARMIGTARNLEAAEGIKSDSEKPVTQAVNDITSGILSYIRSDAVEKAIEYEQEKIEAISHLENEAVATEVAE